MTSPTLLQTISKSHLAPLAIGVAQLCTIASSCLLLGGCDTPRGAQIAQSFLPTLTLNGPGFHHTISVPVSVFESSKLKFEEAVLHGNLILVERYFKPEYANERIKGRHLLCYSAVSGSTDVAGFLCRNGADAHASCGGYSLVFVAASHGHIGTAELLMRYGGGSQRDITEGRALYAANVERQRREAALFVFGALAVLAIASGSGSPDHAAAEQQSEPAAREATRSRQDAQKARVEDEWDAVEAEDEKYGRHVYAIGKHEDTEKVADGWFKRGYKRLDIPQNTWSKAKNDAWIREIIDSRSKVFVATPAWKANPVTTPTFVRELDQLGKARYHMEGDILVPPTTP